MKQTNFTEVGFEHIPEWVDVNYIDNDLIIYSDVKDFAVQGRCVEDNNGDYWHMF